MKTDKAIFCADDWGFSPGINEGILELAKKGLVYSVSCTANTEYLSHGLEELLAFEKSGMIFNIHFNLTYKSPIELSNKSLYNISTKEFYSFKKFFLNSTLKQLKSLEVKREFEEQMRILREHKIPITCLDGHQHIHLFPFVYKSIKDTLNIQGIDKVRYMSDPTHPMSFLQGLYYKKLLFKKSAKLKSVSCGYLLSKDLNCLDEKIKRYKRLIIHPAKFDDFFEKNMTDELRLERVIEYNKLMEHFNE